jgi:hypothetical protein
VVVRGGAAIGRQFLAAGLVDELVVHPAPVLLGAGRRMFDDTDADHVDLEVLEVIDTPAATHLRYRVVPGVTPASGAERYPEQEFLKGGRPPRCRLVRTGSRPGVSALGAAARHSMRPRGPWEATPSRRPVMTQDPGIAG